MLSRIQGQAARHHSAQCLASTRALILLKGCHHAEGKFSWLTKSSHCPGDLKLDVIPFTCSVCTKSNYVSYAMQTVVVDARTHMLGRLSSVVAKQLLSGQQIVSCLCHTISALIGFAQPAHCWTDGPTDVMRGGLAEALVPHRCLSGVRK